MTKAMVPPISCLGAKCSERLGSITFCKSFDRLVKQFKLQVLELYEKDLALGAQVDDSANVEEASYSEAIDMIRRLQVENAQLRERLALSRLSAPRPPQQSPTNSLRISGSFPVPPGAQSKKTPSLPKVPPEVLVLATQGRALGQDVLGSKRSDVVEVALGRRRMSDPSDMPAFSTPSLMKIDYQLGALPAGDGVELFADEHPCAQFGLSQEARKSGGPRSVGFALDADSASGAIPSLPGNVSTESDTDEQVPPQHEETRKPRDAVRPDTGGAFDTGGHSAMPRSNHLEVEKPFGGHLRVPSKQSTKSAVSKHSSRSFISKVPSFFENNKKSAGMMWMFLEDPDSGRAAFLYAMVWNYFVGFSCIFTLLQATRPPTIHVLEVGAVDAGIEALFLLEATARFAASHSFKVFIKSPYNIVDILSFSPIGLRAATGFVLPSQQELPLVHYVLVCAIPVIRLLKLVRRFQKFQLFVHVIKETIDALKVLLFLLSVLVMIFSALIYIVEPGDSIDSLPSAMWLSIVTVTTVGYGDVSPVTMPGRLVTGALVLSSVLYMAMPISIIGEAFTKTWEDRHRLLLMMRTRARLDLWGYTASDMPRLFQQFDSNHNGELSLEEFVDMIDKMSVGMRAKEAAALFEVFDEDGSGGVDEKEFMRVLFPNEYKLLYGRRGSSNFDG
uniref:EF-hand domain-containing protein n=1 Tax=Alexandrium monilatum TaxID=311494 RepID=A0A7S4WDM2_9DINO